MEFVGQKRAARGFVLRLCFAFYYSERRAVQTPDRVAATASKAGVRQREMASLVVGNGEAKVEEIG